MLKKIKLDYDNLKIQTKFAITILIAILTPFMILGAMFYNRLYDMVSADVIRNEQEAAAKTVPRLDAKVWQITNVYDVVAAGEYYSALFGGDLQNYPSALSDSSMKEELDEAIERALDNSPATAVKIYVDMPVENDFWEIELTGDVFVPVTEAKGTYWYGIFQGSSPEHLFCPEFYLGNREKILYGDCAYIVAETIKYKNVSYPCYTAIYYEAEPFSEVLKESLSFSESVSYIINERDAVIASSDEYLTGMYYVDYADIGSYLMSSNNFIERNVLGETIYVSFNVIEQTDWFMVTVTPSALLFQETVIIILEFILICTVCIVCVFLLAMWQARSITTRISFLAAQMAEGRKGDLSSTIVLSTLKRHDVLFTRMMFCLRGLHNCPWQSL